MDNPTLIVEEPCTIRVQDRPIPSPAAGEVRVHATRSLISTGTELTQYSAPETAGTAWRKYFEYPRTIGYSMVGRIDALGEGVDESWMGRRVACSSPHARYGLARPEALAPIPDGVGDEEASLFSLADTAMNGLRRGRIVYGECVAVVGLGIIGQLAARIAAVAGATPVFCIDTAAKRLSWLPKSSPFVPLHGSAETFISTIREQNHGRKVDLVMEVTGVAAAIPGEMTLLRKHGRIVILSSPRGPTPLFDFHDLCNRKSYEIIGSHGFSSPPTATYNTPWTDFRHDELFFDWLQAGRVTVRDMISHRFRPDQCSEAYELLRLRRHEAMAVLFDWETDE